MKKHVIQLPKGYLSQSQIELWLKDPKRYAQIYFEGDQSRRLQNDGMDYGKTVAGALENESEVGDLLTDSALLLLPKHDVRDVEIVAEWKTPHGWLKVLGRPDMLNSMTKEFREIKTGKTKWTQGKAQKHFQMKFYAMLIYLKYKVFTKEAFLDWVETETVMTEVDGFPISTIKPTGHIQSFRVIFTMNDILETMALTQRVAREIETAYIIYLSKSST